jgi:hypothetical protein
LPSPIARSALTNDWLILLQCCAGAGASAGKLSAAEPNFDMETLIALAQAHGVAGQLSVNLLCKNGWRAPTSFREAFSSARRAQVFSTMPLVAELFRVAEILEGVGVEAVVVKGPVLAVRAFGDSSARHYGDIDFLLRNADVVRASQGLCAAGFVARVPHDVLQAQKVPGQYAFRRCETSPLIELHTERTLRYFPRPLPIEDFFRRRTTVNVDGRAVSALCAEDEFVLISVHGAKHFWERLMWISDVAAMVQNCPELDWKRVRKSAAGVGAERMVRVALSLAKRVLRAELPAEMERQVAADSGCAAIVKKIESWLPYAGNRPSSLVQRALFRFQMRGELFAGARYLTRLSFSTTEEDWLGDHGGAATSLRESLSRPFRLAKKYRREPKKPGGH